MQNAGSKLAAAELALFKAGQVLQALVVGQTGSGLTQLQIGDLLIEAQLPQPAQPGTMLQLQVKTGGSAPQLALLSLQPPAVQLPEVARIPLPVPVANVLLREVEVPVVPAPAQTPTPQPVVQPPSQPAVPAQGAPQPQPVVTSQPVLTPQVAPVAAASEPAPVQPVITQPGQGVTPPTSPVESNATAPVVTPPPAPASPAASQPLVQVQGQPIVAPSQVAQPPVAVVQPEVPPVAQVPVTAQFAPAPSAPAQPVPEPVVPPQIVVPATQSVPPAPVQQQVVPPPAVPAAPLPDAPEPVAANPLLVAQAAPKVQQTLAELPRVPIPPGQPAPVAPPPQPATPEQAVAQMAPEAMAKQNSVAPLLQSLAAAVAKPALLPEPVLKAALQVLAQRVPVPDGRVQATDIERAVARSGVFLEAALASAAPVRGDAKGALLNLKAVLEKFLGGAPAANPPAQRETPPLRELPPRAMALAPPPDLPDSPRDVARALHGQTDAAISRVKLGQFAALPDQPNAPKAAAQPELRMELPFLIGHELVMAQLQIAPDGRREPTTRKRGWTMRFAMNFSQTGEVGAEVGLLGKAVNVSLWAAEPETAEALSAALPELAKALEALGLDPGPVRLRANVPEAPKIASGHFVDATT